MCLVQQSSCVFTSTGEVLLFLLADADLKSVSVIQLHWFDQKFSIKSTMIVYNTLVSILITTDCHQPDKANIRVRKKKQIF